MAERQTHAAAAVTSTQPQIAAILLFPLAILSIFTRFLLKFQQSRTFCLDDYILFLSTMCFTAGTGLMFHNPPTPQNLGSMNGILTLLWTTTFLAKFSLLAFFRGTVLKTKSRGMQRYYENTVGICVMEWVYVIVTLFIAGPTTTLYVGLTYFGTVWDVVSDVMIVSIPILILRRSTRFTRFTRQILSLVALISLFILHTTVTILRSYKPSRVSWSLLWLYILTSISILTLTLTLYRNFCNPQLEEELRRVALKNSIRHKRSSSKLGGLGNLGMITVTALPELPKKSWKGVKYFVSRKGKDEEEMVFERCEWGFGWLEKDCEDEPKHSVRCREIELSPNHKTNMSENTFV